MAVTEPATRAFALPLRQPVAHDIARIGNVVLERIVVSGKSVIAAAEIECVAAVEVEIAAQPSVSSGIFRLTRDILRRLQSGARSVRTVELV